MWGLYHGKCTICYDKPNPMRRVGILLGSDGACSFNNDRRTDRRRGGIGGVIWKTPTKYNSNYELLIDPVSENLADYNPPKITNNFAELQAMLVVLQDLDDLIRRNDNRDVIQCKKFAFYIDSGYAMNCIFHWIDDWKEKARERGDGIWLNEKNRPVIHQEILERILAILYKRFNEKTRRSLTIYHCRSHKRDTCWVNRSVDDLAGIGARK